MAGHLPYQLSDRYVLNYLMALMNLYWQSSFELIWCYQCLRRIIANGNDVRLEFPQLGELQIVNTVVNFKFSNQIKPKKEEIEDKCDRYEIALEPYYKKKINPCFYHTISN